MEASEVGRTGHPGDPAAPRNAIVSRGPDNLEALAADTTRRQITGAYCAREQHLIDMENAGQISFHYVLNDGQPQSMMWLIGLKQIFSRQLPNMPREYIVRLVLDRRHRSVALVKAPNIVIGGITYRAFHGTGLGEIAFCAVSAQEQVKGFGTRLMNYAKEFARVKDKLTFFLTYADNNAVGYFAKQGFTKEIATPAEKWQGYIKDYDGGTLMECLLHPKICYTDLPNMILTQLSYLDGKIRGLSNSHIVYPGLDHFKSGKRNQILIANIPGVIEAGWSPETHSQPKYKLLLKEGPVEPTPEHLQRFMLMVVKEMRKQEEAWPFQDPVNADEAPDYYDVVKDPIDLSTIEKRLNSQNYYLTLEILVADFKRMFSNCMYYNASDTIYCKLANQLDTHLETLLRTHITFDR